MPRLPRPTWSHVLPGSAIASVVLALVVVLAHGDSTVARDPSARAAAHAVAVVTTTRTTTAAVATARSSRTARARARPRYRAPSAGSTAGAGAGATGTTWDLSHKIGQLIVSGFAGETPPPSLLAAVRAGQVGGVILMGENTAGGVAATRALTDRLQAAAREGGNPGLLVMTDQEGGEVKRLPGSPTLAARDMSQPSQAGEQGRATADVLRAAGVNVDLAPVADVARVDGFIEQQRRAFGTTPGTVSNAACSFAAQLAGAGIGYTLKHFPGLGSAVSSTDTGPVSVDEPAAELEQDAAPYRACGSGPQALVMVSSAAYPALTGDTPAVLDNRIYRSVMRRDGIDAVTISDDFNAPAITRQPAPALRGINAGLDLVLYAASESSALASHAGLLSDAKTGALDPARVREADDKVLGLKDALGLLR